MMQTVAYEAFGTDRLNAHSTLEESNRHPV